MSCLLDTHMSIFECNRVVIMALTYDNILSLRFLINDVSLQSVINVGDVC